MLTTDSIYSVLESRRKALHLSQAEVSYRAFERTDSAAFQNIRRGSFPSVDKLEALAKALGLDFYFGPKAPDAAPGAIPRSVLVGMAEDAAAAITPAIDGSPEALRAGYLPIPFSPHDTAHSGLAPVAFARQWIADSGLHPDDLVMLYAPDDLMTPTILPFNLMLLDTAARLTDKPAISVVLLDGRLRVCRAGRFGDELVTMSFDKLGTPGEFRQGAAAETVTLIGRVVWSMRSM